MMTKKDQPLKQIHEEHKKNPLGTLADSYQQAQTGDLRSGSPLTTLVLILILLIILFVVTKLN